jgi:hypothetical protein
MKTTKKEPSIREIQAPAKSIVPQFCNVTAIYSHEDFIIIDFGFLAPPYTGESDHLEDTQIARICFPWDATEYLSKTLASILRNRAKELKKNTSKSSKD